MDGRCWESSQKDWSTDALSLLNMPSTCPSCGSAEIRPSHKKSLLDAVYKLQGKHRYRGRGCRRSFDAEQVDAQVKRKPGRRWVLPTGLAKRRFLEIFLFAAMLLVFYFVLTSLVAHDGTGFFSRPPQTEP